MYYYRARWYDASIGKFIQADSIVPAPGNPQSLNRYAYVYNNPLRYTDPSGRFGDDMHVRRTRRLAIDEGKNILIMMYGMDAEVAQGIATGVAEQIVAGNKAVDAPSLHWDTSLRPDRGNPHFLAHAAAQEEMERFLWGSDRLGTPEEFGRVLHSIQDYHRHRGRGYTPAWGRAGMLQYLLDVAQHDESFDLGAFLLHAPQPGHGATSLLTRYVSRVPGLGFLDWLLAEPDAPLGTYPGDAEAIEETGYWIRQYLILWFSSATPSTTASVEMR